MASQGKVSEWLLELGPSAEARTRSDLLDRALRTTLMLFEADAAVIATASAKGDERLVLHDRSMAPAALTLPSDGSEALRRLGQSSEPLIVANLADVPPLASSDGCPGVDAGPAIFTPLRRHDLSPAYLAAFRRRGRASFTLAESRMIMLVGAWLGTALENVRLVTGAKRGAVTDDITEVYNHRFLRTALGREIRRASRYAQPLSVVAVDIDAFDRHQESGVDIDALLKELAGELSQRVRSFDIMARHGKSGFLILLPQTAREGALEVAERMRAAVEQRSFPDAESQAITVSLGVASFPHDGSDVDDLVSAGSRALLLAREQGSNRVATPAQKAA